MKLSSIVEKGRFTPDGYPIWLWSTARQRDLPWIRAEGLIWRPKVWLASSRKAAIGFYPGPDRLILRINTAALDSDLLHQDNSWRQWVGSFRSADLEAPPPALVEYWARLRKGEDKEAAARLRTAAVDGVFDAAELRRDLRTQISRVRPDQLWFYDGRVEPEALSLASEAGFYVSLKAHAK